MLGTDVDLLGEAAVLFLEFPQWVHNLPELLELSQLFPRHLWSPSSPRLEVRQDIFFLQERQDLSDSQHKGHLHGIGGTVIGRVGVNSIPCSVHLEISLAVLSS